MSWIAHVKAYQKEHGCSYKEAMKGAKDSYAKKSQVEGKGLRSIARKMHGGGNGHSGTGSKGLEPEVIQWIFGGGFVLIVIPLVLEMLYARGALLRRVAPEEMRQIAREVEQQIIAQQEEVRRAENV